MYRNILVPVDLSDKHSWRKALPTAISLVRDLRGQAPPDDRGAGVRPADGRPVLPRGLRGEAAPARRQAAARTSPPQQVPGEIECRRIVAEGKIYQEILKAADAIKADLDRDGQRTAPSSADYLLGPNAARVTRHARCSVMVVRE